MDASVTIGHVRGVRVGLHWSVLVIVALVALGLATVQLPDAATGYTGTEYWGAALVTAVVFVASILAHELSHALVAIRAGRQVRAITLWLLGGVAELERGADSPGEELRIAIAGPATSAAVAVVAGAATAALHAAGASPLAVAVAAWIAGMNAILAVFNMVPAAPLDGGRVLRAALWAWRHDRVGSAVAAARAGRLFGLTLVVLGALLFLTGGGGLWFVLLGWFLMNAARAEEFQVEVEDRLAGVRVGDVMSRDPLCAPAALDAQRFLDEFVMRHPFSTFPIVDAAGRPTGLLTLRRLKALDAAERARTPVAAVACPLDEVPRANPDEPLVAALARMRDDCAQGRLLVFEGDRLVGLLSPTDVQRALDRAELRRRAAPEGPGWRG